VRTGGDDVAQADAVAAKVSYKTQIQPLLKTNCVTCHGPTVQNMGVRVDTYANLSKSLSAVTDVLVNGAMPPSGQLADADCQTFQNWVDQGAANN
jgi:mono/diheme cytochrome c family protein